jgi:hypothetical protein
MEYQIIAGGQLGVERGDRGKAEEGCIGEVGFKKIMPKWH